MRNRTRLVLVGVGVGMAMFMCDGVAGSLGSQPVGDVRQADPVSGMALPMEIPIVIVKYFPVHGDRIDIRVTGDWGESLETARRKTERIAREAMAALEEGSRYHGYKDLQARPSLRYRVLAVQEVLQPMPLRPKRPGDRVPLPDYARIMADLDIHRWVQDRGAKEVWLFAYHGDVVGLWESNMSSPFGDVSNSNRDGGDLPVLDRTYTVYHFNYQRDVAEAVENHVHQIEHLLNHVDGRESAPPERWPDLLFWGKFVGSDRSHKMVPVTTQDGRPVYRCGWTHYAPNSEHDYDWANPRAVETDIEDWRPEGIGRTRTLNCERWQCKDLNWKIYWMQNLPGEGHGLAYRGRPLTNWWLFKGDWDYAMRHRIGLVALSPEPPRPDTPGPGSASRSAP
ncbi:MAG: hypothetical protein KBE04_08910 [Phycisphaerae bacterium]|nr:hypothetical protein [Phycisphaerae bacterium]